MRIVREGAATRVAARAASEVESDELDAIPDDMLAADGDGADLFALNQQFHRALIDAARNRFLVQSVIAVRTTLLIPGPSTLAQNDRVEAAVEKLRAITVALRD